MTDLVIFDLDNTLCESRREISFSMSTLFSRLLEHKNVAIITGGTFERLQIQVLSQLSNDTNIKRLFLLPQNGTLELKYEGNEWKPIYSDNLNRAQMDKVHEAIKQVLDIEKAPQSFEPLIDDKGGEITYSPTGINAPWEIKEAYDPDHKKRQKIRDALVQLLPEFEIGIGGSTSIDITKPGMNKLFGVKKLLELEKLTPDQAVYVGDALFPGGNDASVIPSGVPCISVKGPEDTEKVIDEILKTR